MALENRHDEIILVIDRFEDDSVVFESLGNKKMFVFDKCKLNGDYKEGDIFKYHNDKLEYDESSTVARRKYIDDLFNSLK